MTEVRPLILVVDDESMIRRLVLANLERAGYDVMSAADGIRALEVYAKAPVKPNLVILDVMMPEMDGFECAQRLREKKDVPVIFMTAKTDSASKLRGFDLGADDYVCKPFSMEELLARIRAILHRSSKARVETNYHKYENGPITLCVEKRQVLIAGREVHFADTEFQLLAILLKDPGVIHTHVELLRKVWGPESIGEVQYLRVAFARLRRKFEEAGLEGGLISAYSGVGYVFRDLCDENVDL